MKLQNLNPCLNKLLKKNYHVLRISYKSRKFMIIFQNKTWCIMVDPSLIRKKFGLLHCKFERFGSKKSE